MKPARATVCKQGVGRVNKHKNTHSQTGMHYSRHAEHEGISGDMVGGGSVGFVGLAGVSGTEERINTAYGGAVCGVEQS